MTPQTIKCLNAILDAGDINEGLRDALKVCARDRRLRAISKASGVSYGTIHTYCHEGTDDMRLSNAAAVLEAMGLKLYVRMED